MPYLIDGNNLIGHIAPHRLKDPEFRAELLNSLSVFRRVKRTRVLVAFDGHPDTDFADNLQREESITVLFPPPGRSADSVIKKSIDRETDRRRFFVVSSDREIRRYARSRGAKSLDCSEFSKLLRRTEKSYKKRLELKKDVDTPSPLEISHWTELFESKNE